MSLQPNSHAILGSTPQIYSIFHPQILPKLIFKLFYNCNPPPPLWSKPCPQTPSCTKRAQVTYSLLTPTVSYSSIYNIYKSPLPILFLH